MKVFEVEVFGRGGLTHYVFNLARELGARGVNVCIVTAAEYELDAQAAALPVTARVERRLSRLAARLTRLPYRARRMLKGVEFVTDALSVAALAWRERPDVIHLHCTNGILLWLMMCLRPLRIPLCYTAHDVTPHERFRLDRLVYRAIHGLADHIICHSRRDRDRLAEEFHLNPGRVSVIPHGDYAFFTAPGGSGAGGDDAGASERASAAPGAGTAESDEAGLGKTALARSRLGVADAESVALFFGFVREYKGLDLLIEAWDDVRTRHRGARLLIAGDPSRMSAERLLELRREADRVGAVHRFAYVPFEDVPDYFAAADVLVLPYRRISQSGVLLLSLSVGVPVIATRVGAFPEVIEDGRTGILIEPESRDALVDALDRVLGDPELRERLGTAGREMVEETYSWSAIAERTERTFAAMLAGGPSAPNAVTETDTNAPPASASVGTPAEGSHDAPPGLAKGS